MSFAFDICKHLYFNSLFAFNFSVESAAVSLGDLEGNIPTDYRVCFTIIHGYTKVYIYIHIHDDLKFRL